MGSAEIEALRLDVQRCRMDLKNAEARLRSARVAAAPYVVGEIVEAELRGKWQRAIVREVNVDVSFDAPWLTVSKAKADGGWSKARVHAFRNVRKVES